MNYVRRRQFLWALFFWGFLLIAIVANATTLVHLPFHQLVKESSAITRLRFISSQTRIEGGEICTDSVFEVLYLGKGNTPSRIVVRTPGGIYQHLHSHVDSVPQFHPDEEVFLFLIGSPGNAYRIVGWTQGTFRIHKKGASGMETVTQDSAGVPVFDPETKQFVRMGIRDLRVDLFLEKMNKEVHRQSL
jgi:hypothetical protein